MAQAQRRIPHSMKAKVNTKLEEMRSEGIIEKVEDSGITLKLPKCTFTVSQINFFGHIKPLNGIRPDNAKVKAVNDATHTKNAGHSLV